MPLRALISCTQKLYPMGGTYFWHKRFIKISSQENRKFISCQHAIEGAYFLHTKIIPDGGHLFLAQKIYKNFKPRKPEIYFLHKKIIPDGGTYFWHKRFIKNFKPTENFGQNYDLIFSRGRTYFYLI